MPRGSPTRRQSRGTSGGFAITALASHPVTPGHAPGFTHPSSIPGHQWRVCHHSPCFSSRDPGAWPRGSPTRRQSRGTSGGFAITALASHPVTPGHGPGVNPPEAATDPDGERAGGSRMTARHEHVPGSGSSRSSRDTSVTDHGLFVRWHVVQTPTWHLEQNHSASHPTDSLPRGERGHRGRLARGSLRASSRLLPAMRRPQRRRRLPQCCASCATCAM
jgi:hypothetical protein